MTRIYLLPLFLALVLVESTGFGAVATVRGNLVFDNVPELAADPAAKLDA
jgi:hypothetical protein